MITWKKLLILVTLMMIASQSIRAQTMADVQVQDISGRSIHSSSLIDHKTPLIVSFWATYCKPCINELDILSELYPEWTEGHSFRVAVVSIDDSRSVSRAKSLSQAHGWDDFLLLFDINSDFKRALNVADVPHVFIFDKDGKQVYSHIGYKNGDENELLKVIKSL